MRTPKYRKVDFYSGSDEGDKLIREYMNDDREGIKYHESWDELMNILEVMENNFDNSSDYVGFFVISRHSVKIITKYNQFQKTFMYHDYRTRKSVTYQVIVEALKFHMSDEKAILDKYVKEGIVEIPNKDNRLK